MALFEQPPATNIPVDRRHHVESFLMRESLLDKQVMSSTEAPVVRMLPFCHVIKVRGRSIVDNGKKATYPLVEAIAGALSRFKLVIGTGGGARAAHVTAIGMDLGLPTGARAQLRIIDALAMLTCSGRCWRRMAWSRFHPRSWDTCCHSSSSRPPA